MAKTWQIILATVAIFVAGLVAGGATTLGVVHWINHRMMNARMQQAQGQRPPQPVTFQSLRNFAQQLDLSREQRMRIGAIMRRTSKLMQDEIGDVLNPDQRARFEEMIRDQRARFQQYRQGQMGQSPQGPQPGTTEPPK